MDAKQLQVRWTDIEIRKYRITEQQQRLSESEPEDDDKPLEDRDSNDQETKASSIINGRRVFGFNEEFEDMLESENGTDQNQINSGAPAGVPGAYNDLEALD
jgi:hypothetical protein